MSEPRKRRPLPALICLIALTLLTALVWWRVLHRDSGTAATKSSCSTSGSETILPNPTHVTVNVLNSTRRAGLAKKTSTRMTQLGFKVSGYGNDTGHRLIAGVGEIRYAPDQKDAATLLTYYFPGAKEVPLTQDGNGKLIVSLGSKFTAIPSQSSIHAAVTADHLSIQSRTATPAPSSSTSC
jgi:hypothetical protein